MELPHRQQRLYDVFFTDTPRGDEVEIRVIYGHVYDDQANANAMAKKPGGVRYMQQSLGTHIMRLNQKLADQRLIIRPGKTKQTYRLDTLSDIA
jgi:hypothetical protein